MKGDGFYLKQNVSVVLHFSREQRKIVHATPTAFNAGKLLAAKAECIHRTIQNNLKDVYITIRSKNY